MAIVKKMNGTGGSTDGMFFHSFSGMPNDQYTPPFEDDPREHIGETFVIEVRAVEVGNLYADDEDAYDPAQDNPFTIVSNGDA